MSFTITYSPEKTTTKTASIHLTPSKRRRLSPPLIQQATEHSAKEIYSWTFTSESYASCSVRDALNMKENTVEKYDFFWLGSVPCRSVRIVGMVVGIQVYEKRIIYTVDDGTGVIDCSHAHHLPKPVYKPEDVTSKYKMPVKPELPLDLIPLVTIGQAVRVRGRIRSVYDSRQIAAEEIAKCSSANDELLHARTVRQLHRTSYSRMDPFIIPCPTRLVPLATPRKKKFPPTPSTMCSSPASSVSSSPIKPESTYNSPVKRPLLHQSPIKLRYPSRLHTHDLTENTFRIYVKHYMDHAPVVEESGYESDVTISHSMAQTPATPTKRQRLDKTPRQYSYHNTTPRPRISAIDFGIDKTPLTSSASASNNDITRKGFSLSYLRRVPELSLLASRVVEAVSRRRLRDERKKLKEAGITSSRSQKSKASTSAAIPPAKFAGKMKRLFQWAIVQLLKEGCIALWDGPVHRCPDTSIRNMSRLWKANTTVSTIGSDSTLFSTATRSMPSMLPQFSDGDEGALSDPDPAEEAYVPLTSEYLANPVESAIKVLVDHYERIGKPYAGATKEGIVSVLRRDDRWKYVGDWTIDDALEYLKQQGRVWAMGKGRWDLTE